MKYLLFALTCFLSLSIFSQDNGLQIDIYLENAPAETVDGHISFIGGDDVQDFPLYFNNGFSTNYFFQTLSEWQVGFITVESCTGDILIEEFFNSDTTEYYFFQFSYCQFDSILGCTDPTAINYSPDATINDGSCIYSSADNDLCVDATPLVTGMTLIDNTNTPQNEGIFGECWNFGSGEGEQSSLWFTITTPPTPAQISIEAIGDGTLSLTDTQFGLFTECGGEMIYCDGNSGEGLLSAFEFSCGELDTNATYLLMVDGWNGDAGTCFLNYEVTSPCGEEIFGCTNPQAVNYNPAATIDDGSCSFGCTDVLLGFDFTGSIPNDSTSMFWAIYNEDGEVVEEDLFYNWAPQFDLCLDDGCYTLNIFEISPEWAGIYSIFIGDDMVSFGEFDGSSSEFIVDFGINSYECGDSLIVYGCTDPEALNYNPLATENDGSCQYFECDENEITVVINTQNWASEISWKIISIEGGFPIESGSFEDYSTTSELVCLEDGCYAFELYDTYGDGWNGSTFELYVNDSLVANGTMEYGNFAEVLFGVNQDCQDEILGCTDPEALNYNPFATVDDGSCQYDECDDNQVQILFNTQNWGYEISWNIRNEAGEEVFGSGDYPDNTFISEIVCLEDGCYSFEMFDSYGDGWNGATFEMILNDSVLVSGTLADGEYGSIPFGVNESGCGIVNEVYGCTDPAAVNYSPDATINDGSCEYSCNEVYLGFDFLAGAPNDSSYIFMNWTIVDENDSTVAAETWYDWAPQYDLCLENGCYTFTINNVSPEWNGLYNIFMGNEALASGTFTGESDTFTFNFGINADGCDDINLIYGCTDPEALNFNPEATADDGSCIYDFECGISFDVIPDSLGQNTFFIIPSENIVDAAEVLWDFGDGSTSTELYPTHFYESDGPFTLCLFVTFEDTTGNYCEISYCQVLDGSLFGGSGVLSGGFMINVIPLGTLSAGVEFANQEIAVYPNPTNDIATVSFVSTLSSMLTLSITDITGKILEQRQVSSSTGQQTMQVDLSEFPQGLYLIGLDQAGSRTYAKVVRR